MTAGGLALVARVGAENKFGGGDVNVRVLFEERFVNAAEFLGADVLVVNRAAHFVLLGERESADGDEHVAIGHQTVIEVGRGAGRPEEATERGQSERGAAGVGAKPGEQEPDVVPEVGVLRAAEPVGDSAQTADGVVTKVILAGLCRDDFGKEQFTVFGGEQEQEAIDDAEELAEVVLLGERACRELVAQRGVGRMREETGTEGGDGFFHAVAQLVEGASAALPGFLRPFFQPAEFSAFAFNAGLVQQEPEQREVGVEFALHHGLQVELDERLAREGDVIAEQAQAQAVADDGPDVRRGAVQEFLHHAVRAGGACADDVLGTGIEVGTEADEVNGRVLPAVRDGVAASLELEGLGGLQATVAEFLEERQQPLLASERGARVGGGELLRAGSKTFPHTEHAVPRATDGFVEFFTAAEVVGVGREAGDFLVALRETVQEIRGQQCALGGDGFKKLVAAGHGVRGMKTEWLRLGRSLGR